MDKYNKSDRKKFTITCDGKTVSIDKIDYKLLNEIVLNARVPLIDLADKLDISSQAVKYRLDNLIKSSVIKGFRVAIDISKIGLHELDVRINLKDHSERMKIINNIKLNPNFKCVNTTIGYSDLELEFSLEDMDKLDKIMDELSIKFPEAIRTYFYLKFKETYKERWLPELY